MSRGVPRLARVTAQTLDGAATLKTIKAELPERVAAGALDLLMGSTGRVVSPRDASAGTAHVLVEPTLVVR